jgi:hypothetical protein
VGAVVGCTIVDSVDGYAGPPIKKNEPCKSNLECNDDNPCTADECVADLCEHAILAGKSCGDGDLCNGDETCDETGACLHGVAPEVEDDDLCTKDSCDPKTGVKHVPVIYDPITICTVDLTCPADYFLREVICSPDCPPDPQFGVNGVICERICKPELTVCCGDCTATTCPAGYEPAGFQASTCICGQPASGLICKR